MSLIVISGGSIQQSAQLPNPLPVFNQRNSVEKYSNHLGATDNFTQTSTTGTGTATADTTNHEMDMVCPVSSSVIFDTKKTYTLGVQPIVFNAILQNLVAGASGFRSRFVGLNANFGASNQLQNCVGFYFDSGTWYITASKASANTQTTIPATPISDGSLLTVVATNAMLKFYVDGVLAGTIGTAGNIPTVAMNAGVGLFSDASVSVTHSLSTDLFEVEVYK